MEIARARSTQDCAAAYGVVKRPLGEANPLPTQLQALFSVAAPHEFLFRWPVYFSVQVTTDYHSGIPVFRGRIPISRNQYPLTGISETPGIKSTTSPASPSQDS